MSDTHSTDQPTRARAPWEHAPDIAAETVELQRRYSAADLTLASVLCDDHAPNDIAFRLVTPELDTSVLTYGELREESSRLATALQSKGIAEGDRVAVLMGKSRHLPIVLLAIWRLGAVHVPLFTAFAPPAIEMRVQASGATLVIADPDQRGKVDGLGVSLLESGPALDLVIASSPVLERSVSVGPDGLFLQLYTSGTTGTPKGVGVPGRAIAAFVSYMLYGLQVTDEDVFWNAADPGWAYGLYYGIVGPLAIGRSNLLLSGGFSAVTTKAVIETLGVTNFAAAPTVYRAMKAEPSPLGRALRVASSAGEPLTPDVGSWAISTLGTEVRDHYGQTDSPWHVRRAVCWCQPALSTGSMRA